MTSAAVRRGSATRSYSPRPSPLWSRPWFLPVLVLTVAAAVRFPHYDVAWFGLDQIYFMAEARRVLAGHWDVTGPLASGLNIIGPLYSYLLAGLLWIHDDPRFLVLFGISCEVVAAWIVYDIGRRVSGPAAGIAAAISYVTAPVLVLGTRMIWNPSLLPALVALGWWFVVRYSERPSTMKLVAAALTAGLALTLHATGVFHVFGMGLAALLVRRPSPRQLIAAVMAGLLPLLPVIVRLSNGAGEVGALGSRFATPGELLPVAMGLADIVLGLPKAFGEHWTADLSVVVLYVQAAVVIVGLGSGLVSRSRHRPIWIGIAAAAAANIASAFFYTGPISWHYFIALVPMACVSVAYATEALSQLRIAVVALVTCIAASHLLFLDRFDREAVASGVIQVDAGRVGLRAAQVIGYSPTLRDLRRIGQTLRGVVPDGSTAMLMAHGARGELWRETGGEFLPPSTRPRPDWPTQFVLMGPSARPLTASARVLDDRVCTFERSPVESWKARHGTSPAGWELPEFVDTAWVPLDIPQRVVAASLAGPATGLATWRASQTLLRGRLTHESSEGRHALSIVIHGAGSAQYWIVSAFVNGTAVGVTKERVMYSSMSRNHEWLIDVGRQLRAGENVIALALDGQLPAFDLDIFEVPCVDAEWYH